MPASQEIIRQLNRSGKRLSKGHRRIAEYIGEHSDKAVFMTAAKLGETVGVSESTVVRFASAIGYNGYPQMQRTLQELIAQRLTANERVAMSSELDTQDCLSTVLRRDIQNLHATMDALDPAVFEDVVRRILSSESLYIIGLRSAAPLAQFLGYYLNFIFDEVHLVSSGTTDVFESISRLKPGDVLIGISFPRYSTRTLEAMRFAKRCGAQVIAITDGDMSPLYAEADACLTAHTDMASFVDSLAAPMSVINALLVALGMRRKDALSEHFLRLENIWDTYQVYLGEEGHRG
ncbi:MAG: MurR/RpiR family transcriptional regulator [Clostridia bacterium]|nr:MurR/RpiR family transcriptional regulator [Clostridia bacterium]